MSTQNSLELIKRIQSICGTGLVYAQNEYDKERYEELQAISLELMSVVSDTPLAVLNNFFMPHTDYPTPKVDIRGFVLNASKEILLVKETIDKKWSLPGGWGDIGFTPSEVIIKEIQEEIGLHSKAMKLLAVYDKKCHAHPPQPFYVYKMVFLCEVLKGTITPSFDIEDAGYFHIDNLPSLSEDRILESQIRQLYHQVIQEKHEVYFD